MNFLSQRNVVCLGLSVLMSVGCIRVLNSSSDSCNTQNSCKLQESVCGCAHVALPSQAVFQLSITFTASLGAMGRPGCHDNLFLFYEHAVTSWSPPTTILEQQPPQQCWRGEPERQRSAECESFWLGWVHNHLATHKWTLLPFSSEIVKL